MLVLKDWVGILSAPLLLTSVGCISNPPFASTHPSLPPERLMAMGHVFERQGHADQAKFAYQQVIAMRPDHPTAKQSLDTLIAKEMRKNQPDANGTTSSPNVMIGQTLPAQPPISATVNIQMPPSIDPTRSSSSGPQFDPGQPAGHWQSTPVNTNRVIQAPPATLPEQAESPQASAVDVAITIVSAETTETTPSGPNPAPAFSNLVFPVSVPALLVRPAGGSAEGFPGCMAPSNCAPPKMIEPSDAGTRSSAYLFQQPGVPAVSNCSWMQDHPRFEH